MSHRKSICLVIVIFVALAPFLHLPVGHGSFTSVYGPHTPLREYRTSSQLMHSVTAVVILARAYPLAEFDRAHVRSDEEPALSVIATASWIPTLRC